jgi:hypothetical protein
MLCGALLVTWYGKRGKERRERGVLIYDRSLSEEETMTHSKNNTKCGWIKRKL